jgi:integrase
MDFVSSTVVDSSIPSKQPLGLFPGKPQPRLYDSMINVLRVHHYSCFIIPTILAICQKTTQNQALAAILFLYDKVLKQPLDRIEGVVRARKSKRLPVVLTPDEIRSVMAHLEGPCLLIAMILYGGGLRQTECLRLRVKDIDFSRREIIVREGKGDKDRVTTLPASMERSLTEHLESVRALHREDLQSGYGRVELPAALARKYPHADREWGWQFILEFPTESVRSIKRVIVHARSVRDVEEISKA